MKTLSSVILLVFGWALLPALGFGFTSEQIAKPTVTPMHLENAQVNPAVSNANFQNYPACSASNSTSCKNANGVGTNNCVDVCYSKRTPTNGAAFITTSITEASCPPTYATASIFAVDDEYSWTAAIFHGWVDPTTYANDMASNFTCTTQYISDLYAYGGFYGGVGANFTIPNYPYQVYVQRVTCSIFPNCITYYGFYHCSRAAGLIKTGNKVPTGLICARQRSQWAQ